MMSGTDAPPAGVAPDTTVGDILRLLLPDGTDLLKDDNAAPDWSKAPSAPNVFGVAAYLMKVAGVSVYVDPRSTHRREDAPSAHAFFSPDPAFYARLEKRLRKIARKIAPIKKLTRELGGIDQPTYQQEEFTPEELAAKLEELLDCVQKANEKIDDFLQEGWQALINCLDEPLTHDKLSERPEMSDVTSTWWRAAIELLIASDAFCEGIGFPIDFEQDTPLPSLPAYEYILNLETGIDQYNHFIEPTNTLAPLISRDIAVVLPKSVTPTVGCTVRSLSHNLALLPPKGQAGAQWTYAPHSLESDQRPLNMLVVPIPYFFHGSVFHASETCEADGWGFFSIEPEWLDGVSRAMFVRFIRDLCLNAAAQAGKVDALVFPELALSEDLYRALLEEITTSIDTKAFHELEFIVSGLSDFKGERGNFVACTIFADQAPSRASFTRVRAKHHRWKLEGEQIDTYRLSHVLNPSLDWWEDLPPHQRETHFFRFRNTSSFTALICEDLARIDPCQEVLRSVGPDLIISILMDSAQMSQRWPARYATVLAEDPGSSVLTVTSQALIRRANHQLKACRPELSEASLSTAIGLWKDAASWSGKPIEMADDGDAVLLTICNEQKQMRTLDGRLPQKRAKWCWRLTDTRQIKLAHDPKRPHPTFGRADGDIRYEDL